MEHRPRLSYTYEKIATYNLLINIFMYLESFKELIKDNMPIILSITIINQS